MLATPANPWPRGQEDDPAAPQVYSGYGCRPEIELADVPTSDITMPRLTKFKNKAIFADLTVAPARVETRHRTGINVLYGDGSATWIERKKFDADLSFCTSINAIYNTRQDAI